MEVYVRSSSGSASRIELQVPAVLLRTLGVAVTVVLCALVVGLSSLPIATVVVLPLICGWLWWRAKSEVGSVLSLSSSGDQLSWNEQHYRLHDFAIISASVGLRLEDSKGMRKSVLLGPWNSSADDRRRLRLWLARHLSGSAR